MFKRSAKKFADLVAEQDASVTVSVNEFEGRPRRGTFEVRLADGTVVVSLEGMKRPFKPLRELSIEDTVEQALEALAAAGGGAKGSAKKKKAKPTATDSDADPASDSNKKAAPKRKTPTKRKAAAAAAAAASSGSASKKTRSTTKKKKK